MSADEKLVASIIPEGATGISIGLQGASLYVSKDGTAQFVIAEDDMAFEDDRVDDAGGTYWVCRLPLGEIEALRDKLNGLELDGEKEARLAGENARLEYERGRLALDLLAEMDKSRRAASALEASEAKIAALAAERDGLLEATNEQARTIDSLEDRVTALAAENATLREVLKPFAERANFNGLSQVVSLGACQRARAALRQEGKP